MGIAALNPSYGLLGLRMLDVILLPPVLAPLAVAAAICTGAGALLRIWIGLVIAEILSIAGLACLYVIGGSLLNDELTVRSFLSFFATGYFNLFHASSFAFFSVMVFAGALTRKLLSKPREQ